MKKTLCYTMADKGSVCINGVCIPCHDDGWKEIVLTDEKEKIIAGLEKDLEHEKKDFIIQWTRDNLPEYPEYK